MNYTNIQNGLLINENGSITGITNSGSLSSNSYTLPTESVTKSYADTNLLSSTYTQTQSNANFLSANTSGYYSQSQANSNFLTATTLYTQIQANVNFLSANTYSSAQTNANFLSANTSYYTTTQSISNFLSASTIIAYGSLTLASGSISSFSFGTSSPGNVIKSASLTAGPSSNTTISNTNGTITINSTGYYLMNFSVNADNGNYQLFLCSGTTILCASLGPSAGGYADMGGSFVIKIDTGTIIALYAYYPPSGSANIYGYSLMVTRVGI